MKLIEDIKRTFGFIYAHPLTKRHVFRSIGRVLYWQLQTTLQPDAEIEKNFVKPVKYYARKRRAGITGNIYTGLHEFNEMAFVLHFLRETDAFFDLGANVGVYTLLASGVCKAKSVALEPILSTFNLLQQNIELNNLQYKVTLINAAAGDAAGTIIFSSEQDTTNHVIRHNEEATHTIEVEVIKIDSLVHYSPALIKIDVEGFESRVLIGAENLLKNPALKAIIIELSNTVEYGFNDIYTHQILTTNGFSPFSYDPFTRQLSPITELASDNIIYCRDINFAASRVKNAAAIKIMGEKFKKMRLAIINTHPIQYYAPVFKLLHQQPNINVKVFYTYGENSANKYDPGFNRNINWDIPLLDGYPYEYIKNSAKDAGTHTFRGIINPDLIDKITLYKPDVILIYGWAHQSHLKAIYYFKNKIPVYFRGDSTLLDRKTGIKNFMKYLFLKWVYKHIDCALYTGTNNKAYFKKYGLNEPQLKFVPHSIDNDRFTIEKTEDAASLRQQLNILNDDILILFAGKFESKKDPLLLLAAFLNINKPNVHLLFVGNGILEHALKEKASGSAKIHFMDFQNQSAMPAVYQAADLFCLPSKGPAETWGLAVNEAMACKKAILVSDKVGCAIDLVKPGYNGMIFKAGDLNALAAALTELSDKKLLVEMGSHSRQIIEGWSIDVQVKNIALILNGR